VRNAIKKEGTMRLKYAAVVALVGAFVSGAAVSAQNVPADLVKARQERTEALAKGDRAAFDRLTTDNFIVIDAQGRVENKTERGARVMPPANPPQNPPAAHENEKISVYNNDAALLSWTQTVQGAPLHFMETWVKDGGAWKCAAANINRPDAPAGRGEGRGEGGGEGRGRRGGGE
jgi:hypothetical protein